MDKFNRLTLINQFEILKALNPNEEKYYAEKIEILTEGYEYGSVAKF
ncbi:YfbU family protein [Enterococcus faecalis]